ncbi:type VI secretion system membrane subunit TssM [Pleionea mediterranea]|uniref:Type VI secretion system protein ImpL n=1 Tax=Pleionea mediterranea TaxID=523701 RepID=A0A316F943_9GAMM|nr:type VI secretion system membrane subunit TssM [Pleionea mediterranea]PWK42549.1 type VI secretion system protein ImpL [Pleionea mediterranea]
MTGHGNSGGLFRFLLGFATARATGTLLGILAFVSLIWFLGHYVGLQTTNQKLMVIGAFISVVALVFIVRFFYTRSKGKRLESDLSEQAAAGGQNSVEVDALKNKMKDAIKSLKSSHLGAGYRGSSALYALPWYMIIGPSAAGKSTLFANSGLHFPYASNEELHIQGFGGTRNCDWWFSDEAVLLDTAGRYTTEESDRDEWLSFLKMLKKSRSRLPLNGVMVAISIADILTRDADGIEKHVKIIRERIEELIQNLGIVFPVYLVFTKCDLINGFEAFNGDLSEPERAQPWGAYLLELSEHKESDPAELFEKKMEELYDKLCSLRLSKLSIERNLSRKGLIFDFPNQFSAATDKLTEFVNLLFRANPYQEAPWFAGVYFTSGTQEGTPIERLVGGMRQAFAQVTETPKREGITKSYFIQQMFSDVVFKLQDLTRGNRKQRLVMRWLKGAFVTLGLAAMVGMSTLLTTSYTSNNLLMKEGEQAVVNLMNTLKSSTTTGEQRFIAINQLFKYYSKLQDFESDMPWEYALGVYAGDNQLPAIEQVLFDVLKQELKTPVSNLVQEKMMTYSLQWGRSDEDSQGAIRTEYYDLLKLSLMMSEHREKLDVEFASKLISDLWGTSLGMEKSLVNEQRVWPEPLLQLARFYVKRMDVNDDHENDFSPWKIRKDQVAFAREQLYTPPNAIDLYAQIKNTSKGDRQSLTTKKILSAKNRLYLTSAKSVRWIYTKQGWNEYVHDEVKRVVRTASRGDWIIGNDIPLTEQNENESNYDAELAANLERGIRQLYFKDYSTAWLDFLSSLETRGFDSLESGAVAIEQLAAIDGPVAEIFKVVSSNINLNDDPNGKANRVSERVADMANGLSKNSSALHQSVEELDGQLRDIRRFTEASENAPISDLINQYLRSLASVSLELKAMASAVNASEQSKDYAAKVLSGEAVDSELYKSWVTTRSILNGVEVGTHNAIGNLLNEPIEKTWGAILFSARENIESQWLNSVYPAYAKGLKDKFPFNPKGVDAAVADVSDFLNRKSGIYWDFIEQQLTPFVKEKRGRWTENQWLEQGMNFSDAFLRSLRIAKTISHGMFKRNGEDPLVAFDVNPVPGSGLKEISLNSSGQVYRYRNEPEEWRRFVWPGNSSNLGAKVTGYTAKGERAEISRSGHWGLFHLLNRASVAKQRGSIYLTAWSLKTDSGERIRVRFKLRADRHNNLFGKGVLTSFQVPESPFAEPLQVALSE